MCLWRSHSGFPDGVEGSKRGLFVCVHKPNARKQDLESSVKKDRIRGIWEFARLKAHWKPAQKWMATATNANKLDVHISHMHHFALREWLRSSKGYFKSFCLKATVIAQAVDSNAISQHYQVVDQPGGDRVYVPKLNVVLPSPRSKRTRSKRSSQKMLGGCATEGGHVETKTAKKARPAAALDGTAACPRRAAPPRLPC